MCARQTAASHSCRAVKLCTALRPGMHASVTCNDACAGIESSPTSTATDRHATRGGARAGSDVVKLNVGGRIVKTRRETLTQFSGTMLAALFSGRCVQLCSGPVVATQCWRTHAAPHCILAWRTGVVSLRCQHLTVVT